MDAEVAMEDVGVSDSAKDEAQKKKRRVLKRVLKKDKSKMVKPKRKLNTSLSSLSKSLNRSVTSLVIKQTLQSNNRQLAMTLEKTRQELRLANSIIMDQRGEIVDLQSQISSYKYLAGLKPEEIEQEVKCRMEKYIMDLKTHLGKIGQQLFDATTSLGDAMDLCMNASRRSTYGSCRSSTMSVQSDDDGDNHQAVRPAMFQSQALQSELALPSLPQRVARLDMSVIAEQSVLIDDINDHIEELQEGIQEKGIEEETIGNDEIDMEDVMDNQDGADTGNEEISFKGSKPAENKNSDISSTGNNGRENDGNSMDRELHTTDQSVGKNKKDDSSKSEITVQKEKRKSQKSDKITKEMQKDGTENKKDRRGTFVLSDFTDQTHSNSDMQDKNSDEEKLNMQSVPDISKQKRSKSRRETYVLPENTTQKKETENIVCEGNKKPTVSKGDNTVEQNNKNREQKRSKCRRGTFVVPDTEETGSEPRGSNKKLLDTKTDTHQINLPVLIDRRETFVLPDSILKSHDQVLSKSQDQLSSKSHEQITTKKDFQSPQKSKSVGDLCSEDDNQRKTFFVPPLPAELKKRLPQETDMSEIDSETTEYFDCDMEFTEVIDYSDRIILESSNNDSTEQKTSNKEPTKHTANKSEKLLQDKKAHKSSDMKSSATKASSTKTNTNDSKSESGANDKKLTGKAESQSAVEFRVPKPGKIIFAASRKTFDGTRERVPTKLPQKSRSKSKVKLTKPTKTDDSVKSMFDFHERTPKTLKQTTSVYDLSLNESVHGQKDSYATFRDKIQSKKHDVVEIEQQPNDQEQNQKNEDKVQSSKQSKTRSESDKTQTNETRQPNDKGEIIYHLPLKGCSPNIPAKSTSSRDRSQSQGRSKSRGNRIVVVDGSVEDGQDKAEERSRPRNEITDKNGDDIKTDNRGRSRSRKRTEKSDDVTHSDSVSSRSRGRSRSIKGEVTSNDNTNETTEDTKSDSRRGRSRSRKRAITTNETTGDDESDSRSERSRSRKRAVTSNENTDETIEDNKSDSRRGRSRSKKREIINDDDTHVDETKDAQSCVTRGRSKSRKREITGNDKTNETTDDDLLHVTRGRSRSRKREVKSNANESGTAEDFQMERRISRKPETTSSNQSYEDHNLPEIKTTSRSRSNSGKKEETEFDSDGFVACKMIQSKSRGRSRSRKNDIKPVDDTVDKQESPPNITRSKSRGRARSKRLDKLLDNWESDEDVKEINDKDNNTEKSSKKDEESAACETHAEEDIESKKSTSRAKVRKPSSKSGNDIDGDENSTVAKSKLNESPGDSETVLSNVEEHTGRSATIELKPQSCVVDSDDEHKSKRKTTARSRSRAARSKSSALSKPELSDDEDFQDPKKSAKKPRIENEDLNPLDKLFKNTRKKSDYRDPSNKCSESDYESKMSNILTEPDGDGDDLFHVICETPVRCRNTDNNVTSDVSNKLMDISRGEILTGNDLEGDNSMKNSLISDADVGIIGMDLKCVTKRSRSKKIDKNELFNGSELISVQDQNKKVVGEEKENDGIGGSSDSLAKKTPCTEGKTKRRHDSESVDERTKSKKTKTENKENTGSKLSDLKKRLASLGTNLKSESQDDNGQSREIRSEGFPQETEEKTDTGRSSQGLGMLTPVVQNVTDAPRSTRRKAANVCYKEASLNIKMRREDVLQGKKLD